jgi:hypothetical protein
VKPEGRTPPGMPWNKWDNNMTIDFTEIVRKEVGNIKSVLG